MIGRSIGTAIVGLLFGVFVGLDLVLFGVVSLDSPIMVVLAVALAVLGALLGALAGRRRAAGARPAMVPATAAPQGAWAPSGAPQQHAAPPPPPTQLPPPPPPTS